MINSIYQTSTAKIQIDSSFRLLNRLELITIYLLFAVLPFHFLITDKYPFYRELFAMIFCLMIMVHMAHMLLQTTPLRITYISFFIFMWIFYLIPCYMFDPEISIYGEDIMGASLQLARFAPKDYVLRNLFLYLPLLYVIALRGLSKQEFKFLLSIIVFSAPFSIILFCQYSNLYSFQAAIRLLDKSGHGIAYNTYVPYLTFPFITGLYLFSCFKSRFLKVITLVAVLFNLGFILYSTSRQSSLFCLIALTAFLLSQKSKLSSFIVIFGVFGAAWYLMSFSNVLVTKYLSSESLQTSRWEIMRHGLQMLNTPFDWLVGKGLSSVIYSGPHNNYIRFIQRIGIFGMLLTFFPFFYALAKTIVKILHYWNYKSLDRNLACFVTMSLFFTLYHSFFGYPHEDAFCAPYVWFGLAFWIVMKKQLILFPKRGY